MNIKNIENMSIEKILEKYPFLLVRDTDETVYYVSRHSMLYLEIPKGWYNLFFQLCKDIKDLVPEDFYFIQVKEKYNRLICYTANSTTEVEEILAKYAQMSYYVCTVCGAPANKLDTKCYTASFCDGCYKDNAIHAMAEDIKFEPFYTVTRFCNGEYITEEKSFQDEWDRYTQYIQS